MDIKEKLNSLMSEITVRKKNDIAALSTLPQGTLHQTVCRGKQVVQQVIIKDKVRIRTNITKNEELQVQLLKRAFLEEELFALKKYENVLNMALQRLKDIKDADPYSFLLRRFTWMDPKLIQSACITNKEQNDWANAAYEKLDYKPEGKKHITSRGLLVRSKSEALIAEKLYEYNLPFRYEEVIHIDARTYAPDFTILRADGKLMYWEHEGRTDSEQYLRNQHNKSAVYASIGIVPWDNLIITYDTAEGNLNLKIIESEIVNKLVF